MGRSELGQNRAATNRRVEKPSVVVGGFLGSGSGKELVRVIDRVRVRVGVRVRVRVRVRIRVRTRIRARFGHYL